MPFSHLLAEELGHVLSQLGYDNLTHDDLKRVVSRFDTNGDGSIDFNEFVTMMCQAERKDEDEIHSAFRVFDRDGDGTITWVEIMKVMKMLGEDVDEEACKLMVKSVDLDGNGTIDVDEFRKMMRDGFALT